MKKSIFTLLLTLIVAISYGRTLTSVKSGNWDDKSTWTPNEIPGDNDTIIISENHTVTIPKDGDYEYRDILIIVRGTFKIKKDSELELEGNSKIQIYGHLDMDKDVEIEMGKHGEFEIFSSGIVTGKKDTKIEIDDETVFDGDKNRTVYGPKKCNKDGCIIHPTPLPITLTDFKVELEYNELIINWTTMSEVNNSHFNIEITRNDGTDWVVYTTIDGNGNSNIERNYRTTIRYEETYAYVRLVQYDYDGKRENFKPIFVRNNNIKKDEWLRVYTISGREVNWRNGLDTGIYIVYDSTNKPFKYYQK